MLDGVDRRVRAGSGICGALILAIAMCLTPAVAQQNQAAPPAKKSEPAAKGKEEGQTQSAWVKLCEKAPLAARDKDGKEVKQEKKAPETAYSPTGD